MGSRLVYTVGYGARTVEEFIGLLQQYQIKWVVDIRSHPYSRFKPEFSKEALEKRLSQTGIRYVFMGDALGGLPDDETCYTDGRVDYGKCSAKPLYREGISRLLRASKKQPSIALMCSEGKPEDCHRSKLVGESLAEQNIGVFHIDETGRLKTQEQVIALLTSGQLCLFGPSSGELTSRRRRLGSHVDRGNQVES